MTLDLSVIPKVLRPLVQISLRTPQLGPYHNEGSFMESHLVLVLKALEDAAGGIIHPDVPEPTRARLIESAQQNRNHAALYALLHDLDKCNCMTLVYEKGRRIVTWDDWLRLLRRTQDGRRVLDGDGAALPTFCAREGILRISYFQRRSSGPPRMHGWVTANRLGQGYENIVSLRIIQAIRTHEMTFQFHAKEGPKIGLFRRAFGDLSDADTWFSILVNYADQMGSLRKDGQPTIDEFCMLVRSHALWNEYRALKSSLLEDPRKLNLAVVQTRLEAIYADPALLQEKPWQHLAEDIAAEALK